MQPVANDQLRVQRERPFSPHHILIHVAQSALESARKPDAAWLYDSLVAMTFSAMALEALGNAFGERFVARWSDYESASPTAKLRIVAQHLRMSDPDFSKDPWQFAAWLIRFRNKVAHAKPESVKTDETMSRAKFEEIRWNIPTSKLEADISLENAERALTCISTIFEQLCSHTPSEALDGLLSDSFSGTISRAEGR